MALHSMLRSLSYRNFRLFFSGQSISLIGTWMQQVAMSWLVFQLTGSSFQLSLVLFFGQIPSLFLSPVAGGLIDRWNRHRVLLATQTLAMLQAFALAALTLTGTIAVWQIWPLALFLGLVNAFDVTTRQAFLTEMVTSREDLVNAIALNSSIVNGARLLGPSLAGLVLAQTSTGMCFLLNGISYLAVLAALAAMRISPAQRNMPETSLLKSVHEGFRYAFGFVPIRVILLVLAAASLVGSSYNVLLPEIAVRTLHGGAGMLGILTTATGAGALSAAIFLAARKSVMGLGKWIGIGLAMMGGGLICFARIDRLEFALPVLFLIGFGTMVQMASSNTVLQTIVDPGRRARVMSFYTMAFLGMAPVGSLLTGALSKTLGIADALSINGEICIGAALAYALMFSRLKALVLPIYVRLNILPPLADGIQAASELKLVTKE